MSNRVYDGRKIYTGQVRWLHWHGGNDLATAVWFGPADVWPKAESFLAPELAARISTIVCGENILALVAPFELEPERRRRRRSKVRKPAVRPRVVSLPGRYKITTSVN